MKNNLIFLLACLALAAIAWGAFQLFGNYFFLLMMVIVVAVLIRKVGKPKFNSKK